MSTRWKSAGVRADPAETKRVQMETGKRAHESASIKAKQLAQAEAGWRRGLVRPCHITSALDMRGLEGPQVDIDCLAAEPDVDNWEAGILYPSFEQLLALATLTGFPPTFFIHDRPRMDISASMRAHFPANHVWADPIDTFTSEAIRARGLVYP